MTDVLLCDRCGTIITLTGFRAVNKDGRELLLCKVHARDHGDALGKQGWRVEPIEPPEPESGERKTVQCKICNGYAGTRPVKATPESVMVDVVHCKVCDSRTCSAVLGAGVKCDSKATGRDEILCPKGHPLMGGES